MHFRHLLLAAPADSPAISDETDASPEPPTVRARATSGPCASRRSRSATCGCASRTAWPARHSTPPAPTANRNCWN